MALSSNDWETIVTRLYDLYCFHLLKNYTIKYSICMDSPPALTYIASQELLFPIAPFIFPSHIRHRIISPAHSLPLYPLSLSAVSVSLSVTYCYDKKNFRSSPCHLVLHFIAPFNCIIRPLKHNYYKSVQYDQSIYDISISLRFCLHTHTHASILSWIA